MFKYVLLCSLILIVIGCNRQERRPYPRGCPNVDVRIGPPRHRCEGDRCIILEDDGTEMIPHKEK